MHLKNIINLQHQNQADRSEEIIFTLCCNQSEASFTVAPSPLDQMVIINMQQV